MRAFTLIELLVAIAIVAILVTISMPCLGIPSGLKESCKPGVTADPPLMGMG